ncbi:uncharacterized protein METZ01_LOCUS392682 [marine metagenome]|uniref:DUF2061 domain-containing protein n=1 Tax=marine metagenome TaxID=408172 RepID=A0A382V1K1_9ZZZZ
MKKFTSIVRHIFSKKSLLIRFYTFAWVVLCSWYWVGDPLKSISLSISVLVGSMIIQGLFEWIFEKEFTN